MLKKSIMLISVVLLLFVGLAMPVPAAGAPLPWDGPFVDGNYTVKCNIKFYDWTCNKVFIIKEAKWNISQDLNSPKIKCVFILIGIPEGWGLGYEMELDSPYGYVGPFVRKPEGDPLGRIKNKPRLSQWGADGDFCFYSTNSDEHYGTWVINAQVKVDKTGKVKSIKGSIYGWGEFGPVWGTYPPPLIAPDAAPDAPLALYIPTLGQLEGKFTATPVD